MQIFQIHFDLVAMLVGYNATGHAHFIMCTSVFCLEIKFMFSSRLKSLEMTQKYVYGNQAINLGVLGPLSSCQGTTGSDKCLVYICSSLNSEL